MLIHKWNTADQPVLMATTVECCCDADLFWFL